MTFDAFTLSAVRDELERELLDGSIQRLVQTDQWTLVLEIYARRRRRFLLCSADPTSARVGLVEDRPVSESLGATPFLLLLRKHVRAGRILGIQQPRYERVLKLRIRKRDREGVASETELIIEVMGRRSNAVLVGLDGVVLDALRRVGPGRNRRRPVLPGLTYEPPPRQERLDPLEAESYEVLDRENAATPLEILLAERLAGFSPLLGREAAFRATGGLGKPACQAEWRAVHEAVAGLLSPLSTRGWQPTLGLRDGRVAAFAAYELNHLIDHELQAVPSISQAVQLAFSHLRGPRSLDFETRQLLVVIDRQNARAERKRASLERSLKAAEEAGVLREAAEAVLSNLSLLEPGQKSLSFNGQQIELDPRLSPLENAQRLFHDYRKARDAAKTVPSLLATTEFRLRHLEELRVLAELADNSARQRALGAELAQLEVSTRAGESGRKPRDTADGKQTTSGRSRKRGRAGQSARGDRSSEGRLVRDRTPDGLEVLLGTSGRGNELVTFKMARPEDLWLHARGMPGAHVVLRTDGGEVSHPSLLHAARLAARNSQARNAGRVEVDYTLRKHVRKIPAAPPGLVTYSAEKTLAVDLDV